MAADGTLSWMSNCTTTNEARLQQGRLFNSTFTGEMVMAWGSVFEINRATRKGDFISLSAFREAAIVFRWQLTGASQWD
jgi:hypothetical protein